MRLKSLTTLNRRRLMHIELASLPRIIAMARFAFDKAFRICELVRSVHGNSYEWYGFMLAARDDPALVIDIGLPVNDENILHHTGIGPERIVDFQDSLPPDILINGWIHSHGSLGFEQFSLTDERNHKTVLDYVSASLRKPVAKREIAAQSLQLLADGRYGNEDLAANSSVTLITDVPVGEVRILEAINGSFCYAVVIGDGGWHEQEIHYRYRGILTGQTAESSQKAKLILVDTGRELKASDVKALAREVREKIKAGGEVETAKVAEEAR